MLTLWLSRLLEAEPEAPIFPSHQIGFAGDARGPLVYSVDFQGAMMEWKSAQHTALRKAGLKYRWHDLRHNSSRVFSRIQTTAKRLLRPRWTHGSENDGAL
jgi:hypothetical protein